MIQRCIRGDETAWRWLLEQHKERLFQMAVGMLGDESEAEEATQETFVRIFRHLAGFRGGSSLYTWACRICINLCLRRQEHTRKSRARQVSLDGMEATDRIEMLVQGETPEDELLERELAGYLRQELRSLPEKLQATLVLRKIDGLSYEEIAEVLGISLGTVKSRVHRARSLLKERLKDYIYGARNASQ